MQQYIIKNIYLIRSHCSPSEISSKQEWIMLTIRARFIHRLVRFGPSIVTFGVLVLLLLGGGSGGKSGPQLTCACAPKET
jgi:hypothetical protein